MLLPSALHAAMLHPRSEKRCKYFNLLHITDSVTGLLDNLAVQNGSALSCSQQPLRSLACMVQALGRALLRTLEGGKYSHGGFITCRQLSTPKAYLIITRVHVIAVQLPHLATSRWAPTLTWAIALGDLQHCKKSNDGCQTIALLVMQPEMNLLESQQHLAQKALGLRPPPRSPWCLHTASLQVCPLTGLCPHMPANSCSSLGRSAFRRYYRFSGCQKRFLGMNHCD